MLFIPGHIGTLPLPNRLIRSATAERMADEAGQPTPALKRLYQELARGGVSLIVTGHMYVHPSGKTHPEMTGIYGDELIAPLWELADAVHTEAGRIAAQLSHGGMLCNSETVPDPIAPSAVEVPFTQRRAREMTPEEIESIIEAFAQAARRAKEAGFDAIQLHGAHGYLINQFLSPFVNQRTDAWGGDLERRMRFLREVCRAVREQVGPAYPVFIKLGMTDTVNGGLTPEEGVKIVEALEEMGLDAVEISGGIGGRNLNVRPDIRSEADEAYFRPLARMARSATRLPIILVGGLRSQHVMGQVLACRDADFIALSRPFICEPDLPNRLRLGLQRRSSCISADHCWPDRPGEGIACKCPIEHSQRWQPAWYR